MEKLKLENEKNEKDDTVSDSSESESETVTESKTQTLSAQTSTSALKNPLTWEILNLDFDILPEPKIEIIKEVIKTVEVVKNKIMMDLQMTPTPVAQLEIKYEKEAKKVDEVDDDLVKWTSTESKFMEEQGTDQQQLQNQHIDILNNKLKASTDKNEYFES